MAKYFKFVGVIELLGFIGGLIFAFIMTVKSFQNNSPDAFLMLLVFFAVLVFGPAVGLLFLTVGSLVENEDARLQEEIKKRKKQQNSSSSIEEGSDSEIAEETKE